MVNWKLKYKNSINEITMIIQNLSKYLPCLCVENYRTLIKKWIVFIDGEISCVYILEHNIVKMLILPILIYKFNKIAFKSSEKIFYSWFLNLYEKTK